MLTIQAVAKVGEVLAVAWSDGREDYLPLRLLRDACPCAACAGESDATGARSSPTCNPTGAPAALIAWQFVGGYGLQPRWADGHQTGIYSYAQLRKLGDDSTS
jgi:DUF971 family protein